MFKVDFQDGNVRRWSLSADGGVQCQTDETYRPTLYVSSTGRPVDDVATDAETLPYVVDTAIEEWRTAFRNDPESVVRVDVERIDDVTTAARRFRRWGDPGEYRLYNVDFSRQFRYCLETNTSPAPSREARTMELSIPKAAIANDEVASVTIDSETVEGSLANIVSTVRDRVATIDPDVFIMNTAEVVPALYDVADRVDIEFDLGRLPGYQQLAAESTYHSYGRVGYSPARYDVSGRAIIDRRNTFFLEETNLDGCLDLVNRSWKPLQELAWASIGNVLTAIQIREAIDRGVLVPWKSWRHEQFKTARQLDEADRGGYIFAPDVGVHEDVHELDFSSLYPNIICEYNVSPDKIRCTCHADREDVPGLGYSICDERGYLVDVLKPLVDDRDAIKQEIREAEDEDRIAELEGRSGAIKWILVSCFGYQGFSNAKFGRIECHEAINAYAREILLDAKEALEAGGWRVVHGIIDSLWVTARDGAEQRDLATLADEISADVGIKLEYEAEYDWLAFVPQRQTDAGALTKYFGSKAGENEYKYRGIEIRQRSTPEFVATVQEDLIEAYDTHRTPEAVCDRLACALEDLHAGDVDPATLAIDKRTSKPADAYTHYTRTVAALERADAGAADVNPGEAISYVVVDDTKSNQDRVALAGEAPDTYDPDFYADQCIRAAESVLSPLGWCEGDIRQYLSDRTETKLTQFTDSGAV